MARFDQEGAPRAEPGPGPDAGLDRRSVIRGASAGALALVGAAALGRAGAAARDAEPASDQTGEPERRRDRAARQEQGAGSADAAANEGADPALASDADALNLALAVEQLSVAVLAGGIESFDAATFVAYGLAETAPTDIAAMLDQDQAHLKRLTRGISDLGGTPVAPPSYTPTSADPVGFLQLAAAMKETAVAAYATVAQALADPDQRATALGIHSVEARHAALLLTQLAEPAFPAPIDRPLAPDAVEAALLTLAAGAIPPPAAEQAEPAARERTRDADATPAAEPSSDEAPAPETGDDQTAPPREPRRVQDPANEEGDTDAAGPPPVQEVPIEGTTGGLDLPASSPTDGETPDESPAPDDDSERQPSGEGESGTTDQARFAPVLADAAAQLGVDPSAVLVVSAERTDWPDASLGCPREGEFYAQVITPGFRVVVEAAGTQLEYHTDRRAESFVLC